MNKPSLAPALASWENEGGCLPAAGCTDRARVGAVGAEPGPLFGSGELAQVTLDAIADAVISTDAHGRIAYMNATAIEMTGWSYADAMGRPLPEVFNVIDSTTRRPASNPALRAIAGDKAVALGPNCVLVRRNGSELEIEDSAAPIHDRQGHLVGAVIIFRDVRFSHEMVNRMLYLARHDPLTGQANRFALGEQFDLARRMARRYRWKVGLLFIDIDRFKSINDRLGHVAGDQVLIRVANRLAGCLRDADTLTRYGGDEFVVLLGKIRSEEDAARVAKKLQVAVLRQQSVSDQPSRVSLSIGISVFPDHGTELGELIQAADCAMFRTKQTTPLDSPIADR